MKQFVEKAFDDFLPDAQDLWKRGGATMIPEDGSDERRPFFDLEVSNKDTYKKPLEEDEFITRSGRDIGRTALHQIEVNGIDYLARAFIPSEAHRGEHDLTITSGTAWTTTINGYALDRSNKLFADTAQAVLQVGPPHSGQQYPFLLEGLRVPETIRESHGASLARTAQTEQLIFAELSKLYGLSMDQVAIGDSRDSITTPGQFQYAPLYGANIVSFDNKARCSIERIGPKDVPKFGKWIAVTVAGGIAVSLCLAKEGQLHTLPGTTSLNPNFVASSLTGTMRSLGGGEAKIMMGWVPRSKHGIDLLYGKDMNEATEIEAAWADHPGVRTKVVPGGTHPALLHPLAHKGRRVRVGGVIREFKAHKGDEDAMDWEGIYGDKKTQDILPYAA